MEHQSVKNPHGFEKYTMLQRMRRCSQMMQYLQNRILYRLRTRYSMQCQRLLWIR